MRLFIHDPGDHCESVPDSDHSIDFDLPDSEFTDAQRKEIKDAAEQMFEDLGMVYEHLHMNFEDECEECGTRYQPQNLEAKKCVRCDNFYRGYGRHAKNEELLRVWRSHTASKIIKRVGKEAFLAMGMELPIGLCVSCWEPVSPEEWYNSSPVILCKNCGAGINKKSFGKDEALKPNWNGQPRI